mmetsp:Transcript_18102/g.60580  ORF Transcript_18102/g.60580 Transcript_18102/m.60580 type:complete len:345 (-) Transcript_18102:812-1846(-)
MYTPPLGKGRKPSCATARCAGCSTRPCQIATWRVPKESRRELSTRSVIILPLRRSPSSTSARSPTAISTSLKVTTDLPSTARSTSPSRTRPRPLLQGRSWLTRRHWQRSGCCCCSALASCAGSWSLVIAVDRGTMDSSISRDRREGSEPSRSMASTSPTPLTLKAWKDSRSVESILSCVEYDAQMAATQPVSSTRQPPMVSRGGWSTEMTSSLMALNRGTDAVVVSRAEQLTTRHRCDTHMSGLLADMPTNEKESPMRTSSSPSRRRALWIPSTRDGSKRMMAQLWCWWKKTARAGTSADAPKATRTSPRLVGSVLRSTRMRPMAASRTRPAPAKCHSWTPSMA